MSNLIYCDNAATTRPFDEVIEATAEAMKENYGNPSSLHKQGMKAKSLMEKARKQLAALFNSSPTEVVFTSGGTESNNIAIKGLTEWAKENAPQKNHLITCVTEHSSVYEVMKSLKGEKNTDGSNYWEISYLKVTSEGFIDLDELAELVNEKTLLVSIMHANNEIGSIQDIDSIGSLCKSKKVFFHSDAVQSAGKINIDVNKSQVDLLSISGHKLNGPKGIGALYIREGIPLCPLLLGGSQEKKLSPGTENIAGIAGFGKAAEMKLQSLNSEKDRLREIQSLLMSELLKLPGVSINGTQDLQRRVPGNVNISHEKIDGDTLVMQLNLMGICASSGSACSEGKIEPSRVIASLHPNNIHLANNSLRLSLGTFNDISQVSRIVEALKKIIE